MVSLDRKYLLVMMEAGYVYLGMQRFEEATKVFEGIAALAPDSEVPIVALGGVSFCKGDFKDSIRHYKKALKIDPDSLFAKVYLGEALFFSGEKEKAMNFLQEVLKADHDGAAGNFAKALLEAIDHGFTPGMILEKEGKQAHAKAQTQVH
ncbi:MAG: hypothetical protein COV43_05340 [Deltaproteobacteria bacterium CG11_big_fil_rev_8_21_14_0_20_42_23]|nr:MAG: hypothetical protein COV43_05340 [Deltaproteobacteria bacterium CG11_big_fil_rev_8_21_14_0_20_42_23]PJC64016.1 MAG: hypothetical protein CO021_06315 [Deltaproteobacteria bacterium CG_4_9_14_0_2_um_filter_42_21]